MDHCLHVISERTTSIGGYRTGKKQGDFRIHIYSGSNKASL